MAKSNKKYDVKKSKVQGDGAFAKQNLNSGDYIGKVHTIIQPYVDYEFTELGKKHNHSDNPNVQNVLIGNERHLVAIKPIKKGQELKSNYRLQPDLEQPEDFQKAKNGGWLDKYNDGGPVQENYNDASVSLPDGFVGMGYNTQGRNYSPAWGGQFEDGGEIPQAQNGKQGMVCYDRNGKVRPCGPEDKLNKWLDNPMGKAEKAAEASGEKWFNPQTKKWEAEQMDNFRHPMAGRYTAEAISNKFPAVMRNLSPIPRMAGFIGSNVLGIGHELLEPNNNPDYSLWDKIREGGEDAFNNMVGAGVGSLPFVSDATKTKLLQSLSDNNWLPDGVGKVDPKKNNGKPNLYKHALGGSIPGSVGFTYARTGSIPSNGPYAKKTKASAENGKEMSYYQHGLDWKPKSISRNGSDVPKNQNGDRTPIKRMSLDEQMAKLRANQQRTSDAPSVNLAESEKRRLAEARQKADAKRTFISQGRQETPEEKARNQRLKEQYVQTHPYSALNDQGNIVRKQWDRNTEGVADPNTTAAGIDKGLGHVMTGLEAAGYVTGAGELIKGVTSVLKPAATWTRELVEGSLAAGKPKLPEFVTALRTEAAGFNPANVAPHPSLNPTQQTFTGSWIQNASKRNPEAFDELLAYVTGPERKQAGEMQLLSDVIPWSKAQKITGKNLPLDAKLMSFGAGKYGSLENAFNQGAITAKEFTLLKNYNSQAGRIAGSENLTKAMQETISKLRAHPELYNTNEMLSAKLASALRETPVAVGSADVIASGIENLKTAALESNYILDPIKEGIKSTGEAVSKQVAKKEIKNELNGDEDLKKGGKIKKSGGWLDKYN